jgi:hypothetical protein
LKVAEARVGGGSREASYFLIRVFKTGLTGPSVLFGFNISVTGHGTCSLDYQRAFPALSVEGLLAFSLGSGQCLVKATDLTSGFVGVYDALTCCLFVGFLSFIPELLGSLGVIGL